MKSEKKILVAFILNLAFSLFEFFGGIISGSIAILSDSLHDAFDAMSIFVAYLCEKKSKRKSDSVYTFGYSRYCVIGSIITSFFLLSGSLIMIYNALCRIISPVKIDHEKMLLFAVIGVIVNFCSVYFTHGGASLNQKAVSLHMLEDMLGWFIVLIGAVFIKFTKLDIIDPVMSFGVSVFILINAFKILKDATDIILEKAPKGIDVERIKKEINEVQGVTEVRCLHVWSLDGQKSCAAIHVLTSDNTDKIKQKVYNILKSLGITFIIIEADTDT